MGNEGGYLLRTNPDTVLAPDIAVLTEEQLQRIAFDSDAFIALAPALVVEIKSPSDREPDIARKLAIYLEAGVSEVWWVRPKERTMTVHRPDRAPEFVEAGQAFAGSDVLSGFSLDLAGLFDSEPVAP
jgi:Uma2 family endonuclease